MYGHLSSLYASQNDRWLANRRVNIVIVGVWVTFVTFLLDTQEALLQLTLLNTIGILVI